MNYYKRHIGDYMKDAGHLSLLEHGIYCRLIDVYYSRETGIPAEQAARLIGAKSEDELQGVRDVLSEFFTLDSGVWGHKRCEEEIAAMRQKAEINREVGKKGGRPKKTEAVNSGNPQETQTVSENNPDVTQAISHKPLANNQDIPPRPPRGKTSPIGIKAFIDNCRAIGEKAISTDDPVFDYAEQVGLPDEFLRLAWREFVDRHRESEKRYRDWRKAFRNSVRGNWYKLWWAQPDGAYALTTVGIQAQRKHGDSAA